MYSDPNSRNFFENTPNDPTIPSQNVYPQNPLYQTSYLGVYIKVYGDHVDFKTAKGAHSLPLNQIMNVQRSMGQITIETRNGQKYPIPTHKSQEVQQAINQARFAGANPPIAQAYQHPYQSMLIAPQPPIKRSIFRWYWRQHPAIKVGIGCPASIVAIFVVIFFIALVSVIVSPPKASQTSHQAVPMHQAAQAHISTPEPTAKPTPRPTPTPLPKPTPTTIPPVPTTAPVQQVQQSQPTQPPAPPTCSGVVDGGVCYSTDSNGGQIASTVPGDFCNLVRCVSDFQTKQNGFVALCNNGVYTHSGGVSGACSRDGGVAGPLYSH